MKSIWDLLLVGLVCYYIFIFKILLFILSDKFIHLLYFFIAFPYLTHVFELGVLEVFDVVSLHPYRGGRAPGNQFPI